MRIGLWKSSRLLHGASLRAGLMVALCLSTFADSQEPTPVKELLDLFTMYKGVGWKGATPEFKKISTLADWQEKRENIRARVLDIMGNFPAVKPPAYVDNPILTRRRHIVYGPLQGKMPPGEPPMISNSLIAWEDNPGGYIRRKVVYASGTGDMISAYILIPEKHEGKKLPAILSLHSSYVSGKESVAHSPSQSPRPISFELVQRGYVVLVPDSITTGERVLPSSRFFTTAPFDEQNPNWSLMGKMLWDHMRGIDYLLAHKFVDGERIGVIGHSLGGYNAYFLAAFDPRVKATVVSCGFGPLAGSAQSFEWARKAAEPDEPTSSARDVGVFVHFPKLRRYLEAGIAPFDFHEVLAMVAPRALFLYIGKRDRTYSTLEMTEAAVAQVKKVYELHGAGERMQVVWGEGGHEFPEAARNQAYEWLAHELGK